MDSLEPMRRFVEVVEAGSVVGAARRLGVSGPSVSRQLAALEAHLGLPLLVRTTRRMRLTAAGQAFYLRASRLLADLDEAEAEARGSREVEGGIVVSAPVAYGLARVVPALDALLGTWPKLRLDLRLEDHRVDLVAEGVDVAVRVGLLPDSPSLVARSLGRFARVVVASPAYLAAAGAPARPDALSGHRCLCYLGAEGPLDVWTLVSGEERVEVPVFGGLRTNTPLAVRQAALDGLGVALLPDWMVVSDIAAGGLVRVLSPWETPWVPVHALHRLESRRLPRVRAVVEWLAGNPG